MSPLSSGDFPANAHDALADEKLQAALVNVRTIFRGNRTRAVAATPEFEALREAAAAVKRHVVENLDAYLERFISAAEARGGVVHLCADAASAREAIAAICRGEGAKLVTKGKSMVTEEIGLNPYLESQSFTPVETDLGEYIVQLRGEPPSHIIAPACHVKKEQVAETFRSAHPHRPAERDLSTHDALLAEARAELRARFLSADVGITGANLLIAETGDAVLVTNEGNGDLTQSLPRCHIVVASIEKLVPTLEDAATVLRVLGRSATGQAASSYTTLSGGVAQPGEEGGPAACHVVILDNGRSVLLGGKYEEMLRCIRCGACINHCPIFAAVGGHAYGAVYVGPMGSVLTPLLQSLEAAHHLPHACTLCGRCAEVCPMKIPLPDLLRRLREETHAAALTSARSRMGLRLWTFLAQHPSLYRGASRLAAAALRLAGRRAGVLRRWPLAGGWTRFRDLPVPQGGGFVARVNRQNRAAGGPGGPTDGQ
ncbi:MAG: lactate utilization protein B [Rhodospirillaceae bacterium]